MLFGAKLAAVEILPKALQHAARLTIKAEETAALRALSERDAQARSATAEVIRKLVAAYRSAALSLTTRQTKTPNRPRDRSRGASAPHSRPKK